MRAKPARATLGAVALSLGFGALVAFAGFTHASPFTRPRAATAVAGCDAPGGGSARGFAPVGERGDARTTTLVQIVTDGTYGAAYLDALRSRLGMAARPPSLLAPWDVQHVRDALRFAPVTARGSFRCGGMPPGRYIAVVTTLGTNRRILLRIAPFTLRPRRGATIFLARTQFHPLAAVSR